MLARRLRGATRAVEQEEVPMGTWGSNPFENDAAADLIEELEHAESWDDVGEELIESSEDLADEGGEEVVAIAALVAWSHGRLPELVPEDAAEAVGHLNAAPPRLVHDTRVALGQVLEASDLKDRWKDSPDAATWEGTTRKVLGALDELDVVKA
jgi:hypothetical protein